MLGQATQKYLTNVIFLFELDLPKLFKAMFS